MIIGLIYFQKASDFHLPADLVCALLYPRNIISVDLPIRRLWVLLRRTSSDKRVIHLLNTDWKRYRETGIPLELMKMGPCLLGRCVIYWHMSVTGHVESSTALRSMTGWSDVLCLYLLKYTRIAHSFPLRLIFVIWSIWRTLSGLPEIAYSPTRRQA